MKVQPNRDYKLIGSMYIVYTDNLDVYNLSGEKLGAVTEKTTLDAESIREALKKNDSMEISKIFTSKGKKKKQKEEVDGTAK